MFNSFLGYKRWVRAKDNFYKQAKNISKDNANGAKEYVALLFLNVKMFRSQ